MLLDCPHRLFVPVEPALVIPTSQGWCSEAPRGKHGHLQRFTSTFMVATVRRPHVVVSVLLCLSSAPPQLLEAFFSSSHFSELEVSFLSPQPHWFIFSYLYSQFGWKMHTHTQLSLVAQNHLFFSSFYVTDYLVNIGEIMPFASNIALENNLWGILK